MKIAVIPDTQVKKGVPIDHLLWAGKYIAEKKPDVIVHIGDHWDFPSLSSYDKGRKSFEGRRYLDDVEAGNKAMDLFLDPIKQEIGRQRRNKKKVWNPRMVFTTGNHCLTKEHEVLTRGGFKPINGVVVGEDVWTLNKDNTGSWNKVSGLINKPYKGPLHKHESRTMSIECTPEHRVIYTNNNTGKQFEATAKDSPDSCDLFVSSTSSNGEYTLSDKEISLAAWFCTDSHYTAGKQVVLYQREANAYHIDALLKALYIEANRKVRHRDIKEICGKTLKDKVKGQVEWFISVNEAHKLGVYNNKELPDFVHKLSGRQFKVFLDTVVEADGSLPTRGTNSRVVYGKKHFCDSVQQECIKHGYRASLTEYRPTHWRVNITKSTKGRQEGFANVTIDYEGSVHCLTVNNGNFLVRHNNKCHFTGNCNRVERAIDADAILEGVIGYQDLNLSDWEVHGFLEPVIIEGVAFSHYFVSGIMGRPVSSARSMLTKKHMSCVMGHVQDRDIAFSKRADGTSLTGIFAGIFYQHSEDYLTPQTNGSWRGIWFLNDVKDGSFDEMPLSLEYLKGKYGGKKK